MSKAAGHAVLTGARSRRILQHFIEPLESRTLLAAQQLITDGSFNSGIASWVRTGDFWADTTIPANARTAPGYAAGGVNTSGSAINNANGSIHQEFTVPASATSVNASWWYNITSNETTTTNENDLLRVQVLNTAGTVLSTLTTYSNLNKTTLGNYQEGSASLQQFTGQAIRLRFLATSNGSSTTTFRIDDVSVVANTPDATVTSVSPDPVVGSSSQQWITVNGSGFQPGFSAVLRDVTHNGSPTTITSSSSLQFVNSGQVKVLANVGTANAFWSVQIVNSGSDPSNTFNFKVVAPTVSGISGRAGTMVLDLLDQLAPQYYRPTWNITLEQFKAWVATIAHAEGGPGHYVAHSQGAPGWIADNGNIRGDRFAHIANSAFRFSTGLGPFQLDNGGGGGGQNWTRLKTIDKLNPNVSVESTLAWHFNRFTNAGTTLANFSASSVWFAVKSSEGSPKPGNHWSAVTGTSWDTHGTQAVPLNWTATRNTLAARATGPGLNYENNVRDLGMRAWNISGSQNIRTLNNTLVNIVGNHQTWLITARNWSGTALFDYYYTHTGSVEAWVLADPNAANPFRLAFFREHTRTQHPEHVNSDGTAGKVLTTAALNPNASTSGVIDVIHASHVQSGTSANTNFNSSPDLLVKKSSSGTGDRETYIMLDLTQVPANVTSAKLRLNGRLNSVSVNSSINITAFGSSNTSWTETAITWNNRPAASTAALITTSIAGTAQQAYELDLTNYVKQLKAANVNATTIILRGTANTDAFAAFVSDEAPTGGPQLHYSTAALPPAQNINSNTATYVRGGTHANTNFGSFDELHVKRAGSLESTREAFIKFDLNALSSVNSAKLRLNARLSANGFVAVSVHGSSNTSWDENTTTWNNRPGAGGTIAGFTVNDTTAGWIEVDLTSYIAAELAAGRKIVTLVLRGTTATDPYVIIASDEAANGPRLVIG